MHISTPPKWFHPHGLKMALGDYPICQVTHEQEVMVGSNVARLQIRPSNVTGKCQVLWQINHGPGEFVQGQVQLTKRELENAFDISGRQIILLDHVALDLDAEDFVQGRYIRKGKFLNIPMPGIGHDGDSNISVFVTDEIQQAVRDLLALHG